MKMTKIFEENICKVTINGYVCVEKYHNLKKIYGI